MNRKLTAFLLILAAVLANIGFTALGSIFNYPDVLNEPAGEVLAAFRSSQIAVGGWFLVLACSAALLAPVAVGVGRLSSARAMRIAVPVGIAAAAVQVVGLLRWPILVPGFAADAASGDPAIAAAARDAFTTASAVLGTAVGETLGYLLTAAWTVLVVVALGHSFAGRWFQALGLGSAVLVLAGVVSPLGLPVIDTANFVGYILWSAWLIAFAVLIVRRDRRPAGPPTGRGRTGTADGSTDRRIHGRPAVDAASGRAPFMRTWLRWTAGFLAFPLAGVAGAVCVGRVDSPAAALLGGAVTGLVIGAGQALVGRRRLEPRRWIPATTVGMGLGLLVGASAVGYRTGLADLALRGAVTGVALGVAQTLALPASTRTRWTWAPAVSVLWALGWVVTTLAMVAVDEQFTVFGASGALTFSALSGVVLHQLLRPAGLTATRDATTTVQVAA